MAERKVFCSLETLRVSWPVANLLTSYLYPVTPKLELGGSSDSLAVASFS